MSNPSTTTRSPSTSAPRTTTVVLVDPTSPDGESSLEALRDQDEHVLVVVLVTGRASNALHEYAHHERVSLSRAAWTYLDQVAQRIDRPGRTVGTIAASGPDPAYELAVVAAEHDVDRVVLPASILRLDRHAPMRLARLAPVLIQTPALT
jgi:hypothetical protein